MSDDAPDPEDAAPAYAAALPRDHDWRLEIVTWVRGGAPLPAPRPSPRLAEIATRLAVPAPLVPALARAYGAHLCGEPGAAPIDIARVLGGAWPEALGRGWLAANEIARYANSRVALALPIQRALDELPPLTGTLVGSPSSFIHAPTVIVSTDPLIAIAQRLVARSGGAILVPNAGVDAWYVVFEARLYGVTAILQVGGPLQGILVARDHAEAAPYLT